MPSTIISWAAVGLLLVTSVGLLLSRDWRWSLGFLAAQYLGMFWLVTSALAVRAGFHQTGDGLDGFRHAGCDTVMDLPEARPGG